jgi:hypothetical protein
MKVGARSYKGIEFVTVADLPPEQQHVLRKSHDPERIIVAMDNRLLRNCLLYKEYERWYYAVYKRISAVPTSAPATNDAPVNGLLLHKAQG